MMKGFLLCILIIATLSFGGSRSVSAANIEEDVVKAAQAWLALGDSGKNAEAWDEAAQILKNQITKREWVEISNEARITLGKVESRTLTSTVRYIKSLPDAPGSEYVTFQYETIHENQKQSIETLTLIKEKDEQWRVAGYFINR